MIPPPSNFFRRRGRVSDGVYAGAREPASPSPRRPTSGGQNQIKSPQLPRTLPARRTKLRRSCLLRAAARYRPVPSPPAAREPSASPTPTPRIGAPPKLQVHMSDIESAVFQRRQCGMQFESRYLAGARCIPAPLTGLPDKGRVYFSLEKNTTFSH